MKKTFLRILSVILAVFVFFILPYLLIWYNVHTQAMWLLVFYATILNRK